MLSMLPIHLILYYIFLLYLTHRSTLNLINLLEVDIIFKYSCLNLLLQKSDKTRAHSSNWRISWDNLATSLAPYLLFQADGTCQVCTIRIWILDWFDIQVVCSIIKWSNYQIRDQSDSRLKCPVYEWSNESLNFTICIPDNKISRFWIRTVLWVWFKTYLKSLNSDY